MLSIEIIRLQQCHENRLKVFFNKINNPYYLRYFSPHPFSDEHAKTICEYQGRDLYYSVLLNGQEIIGYCMLRGFDEGYEVPSIGLCILKKYQRMGLGTLLIDFMETLCRLNNCNKVMLKVTKSNKSGLIFYKKNGYVLNEFDKEFLIGVKNLLSINTI